MNRHDEVLFDAPMESQLKDDADGFIEVSGVSLVYEAEQGSVQALDDVSIEVSDREFVSLIGPSGCGKTSLLKILGDLLQPSNGTVRIGGRDPSELRKERVIGNMFQDPVLLPWKTIRANMRFLCELAGKELSNDEVSSLAAMLGLEQFLDSYPHQLSGGMRQRAAIGRALALDPLLLLMDEPFGALDEITREKMNAELLRIWHERPKTVIFVTHSISEAAFLSDRVLVMSARPGRILADVRVDIERPRPASIRYSTEMAHKVRELSDWLGRAEDESGD